MKILARRVCGIPVGLSSEMGVSVVAMEFFVLVFFLA